MPILLALLIWLKISLCAYGLTAQGQRPKAGKGKRLKPGSFREQYYRKPLKGTKQMVLLENAWSMNEGACTIQLGVKRGFSSINERPEMSRSTQSLSRHNDR